MSIWGDLRPQKPRAISTEFVQPYSMDYNNNPALQPPQYSPVPTSEPEQNIAMPMQEYPSQTPQISPMMLNSLSKISSTGTGASTGYGSTLSTAGPVAGSLLGAYLAGRGIRDAYKGKKDNSSTGLASRVQAGITTGGLSEVGRLFAGGKNKDQKARDGARSLLKERGLIDDNYNLSLSDGTKYDIGKDGKTKNYNVDFKNPNAGKAVAYTQTLSDVLLDGMSDKQKSDMNGYFANALLSSKGDIKKNALELYQKSGIDKKQSLDRIKSMEWLDQMDSKKASAYRNTLNELFG